jgi:hypothetical protein
MLRSGPVRGPTRLSDNRLLGIKCLNNLRLKRSSEEKHLCDALNGPSATFSETGYGS